MNRSPLKLWSELNDRDQGRLQTICDREASAVEGLVRLTEMVIRDYCAQTSPRGLSEKAQIALVQLLKGYEGIVRLGNVEIQALDPILAELLPPGSGSRRRRLLNFTARLRASLNPAGRGRPRADAEGISELAEDLLQLWVEHRGEQLHRSYSFTRATKFYEIVLPKVAVVENSRPRARRMDWDGPGTTLADDVLPALGRAARRLKRRAGRPSAPIEA